MRIKHYDILEILHKSEKTTVYKVIDIQTGKVCVIKTPTQEYPEQEILVRFRKEYEFLMRLDGRGTPRALAFFEESGTVYLVMEFGGKPLIGFNGQVSIGQVIHMFIQAAKAMNAIHAAGVVHKDINPSNLLLFEDSVLIIDFDVACLETECPLPEYPEGTFHYIAPEQTGKVDYGIDARTDHYALGATFYHMLTGNPLYGETEDLAALIHLHVAKTPVAPSEIRSQVPLSLSDIIMKLLEKNPLDRYQTMEGLIYDIERVSTLRLHERFILGTHDGYRTFRLHQRLYGREAEMNQLMEWCLGKNNRTIIHMYGNERVGKSIILQGLQKKLDLDDLFFAHTQGVDNPLRQSFRMWSQIVNGLIEQILYLDDDSLDEWRAIIDQALGRNAKLLLELSPLMEVLVGNEPELSLMGAEEGRRRLNRTLVDFIKLFAVGKNRLVLSIEDIQYVDTTFLEILESIMLSPEIEHMTVILVSTRLDSLQKNCGALLKRCSMTYVRYQIEIKNLSFQTIGQVLNDYRLVSKKGEDLAGFLHQRTKGNPYHMNLLIQLAIDHGYLNYDEATGLFMLDLESLDKENLGIDAERLIAEEIKQLDDVQKQLLAVMAHLGYECDFESVRIVSGIEENQLEVYLQRFMRSQLIHLKNQINVDGKTSEVYSFFSYHVHELALSLLTEEKQKFYHDTALKLISATGGIENITGSRLLNLVDYFQKGNEELMNDEHDLVARLERKAGDLSRSHGHFESAFIHYTRVFELNPEPDLDLYNLVLEMAFLTKRYEAFETWNERLMSDFQSESDRLQAHLLKMKLLISNSDKHEIIDFVLNILNRHGMHIKKNPTKLDVLASLLKVKMKLGKKPIDTLESLPRIQSQEELILLEMLSGITSTAYLVDANLYVLITLKQMEWVCIHGTSSAACNAFALYALVLCAVVKDYRAANEMGRYARKRMDSSDDKSMEAKTYLHYGLFVMHYEEPLHRVMEIIDQVYTSGVQNGDYEYASWGKFISALYAFYQGERIDDCILKFEEAFTRISSLGQVTQQQLCGVFVKQLKYLGSPESHIEMSASDIESLMSMAKNHEVPDSSLFYAYLLHFITFYFSQSHKEASNISHEIEKRLDNVTSTININIYYFYDCLNKFKLCGFGEKPSQRRQREFHHNLSILESWSEACQENYKGKYLIAKACHHAMNQQFPQFLSVMQEGIEWSSRFGFVQEEAIGKELLMEYYTFSNQPISAKEVGKKAIELYELWGCRFKVNQLNKRLNLLSDSLKNNYQRPMDMNTEMGTLRHNMEFDAMVKAMQALATEINEDRLIDTFMKVIAEHAGADKVILFTTEDGGLVKRAMWNINDNPLEDAYPTKIVNFVSRAKVEVVFSIRDEKSGLVKDPYIELVKPQSILCIPMFYQNTLKGVCYLENKLTPNAFKKTKGSIIEITMSQLVISLENSRLVSRLEAVLEERTKALVEMSDNYKNLSITDQLTGLFNRRELERQIRHEYERARRYGTEFSVILMDIDHFKSINDKYGHYAGDGVLTSIGNVLRTYTREADTAGRWGGEEFLVLCPETAYDKAKEFAEIIRQRIEAMETSDTEPVTASFGVASYSSLDDLPDRMVDRADEAMYLAKMEGRNTVR